MKSPPDRWIRAVAPEGLPPSTVEGQRLSRDSDLTWPPETGMLRHRMTHLHVLKPKPTRSCLEAWV